MYSKYYDRLNGSYDSWYSLIDRHTGHLPRGSSVIDYGCGTGNVLFHYRDRFRPFGVDISPQMLDQAIAKMPEGHFVLSDMVTFESETRFDVSLCLFDAVNHILDRRSWQVFFKNVAANAAKDGVFIVDMNTTARLESLTKRPPMAQEFDDNYLYMAVRKKAELQFTFDVRVMRRVANTTLEEEREEIGESSMMGAEAHALLKKCFAEVIAYNDRLEEFSEAAFPENEKSRWFLVCRGPTGAR